MFINVKNDHEIELVATGSIETKLLKALSEGVHVQAYDEGNGYASFLIITPELLPETQGR